MGVGEITLNQSEEVEGAKFVGGWWMPDHELHFIEMMRPGAKRHELRDGRWCYQVHKLDRAMGFAGRRRVALDIGAHVGFWSYHLAGLFEQVHAFEPVPRHADLFELNLRGRSNWTLHRVALGETRDTCRIEVPEGNTGNAHITGPGELPMAPLDSFGLERVDFVKIDVEGYELPVVKGAVGTLTRCRPLLVIEQKRNERKHFGGRPDEALEFLLALGMTAHAVISGDHILGW